VTRSQDIRACFGVHFLAQPRLTQYLMHPYLRKALAVVVGIGVAFGLVAAIEAIGQVIYPPPAGVDFTRPDQVRTYMQGLPVGAFLFVLTAWTLAAFGGGVAAAVVARERPMLYAGIVGAAVLAATAVNLVMLPHPTWVVVGAVVGIGLGALVAGKLVARRFVPRRAA
jgi:hypothetical protein